VDADTWLARLQVEVAEVGGAAVDPVGDEERDALLELARIAAHTSERWTAPITTYLAGVALAGHDPTERAAKLRELLATLP
jgi:hypothetical protein